MRLPFHLITKYAGNFPMEMENASIEFFGENYVESKKEEDEVTPLFVEFITFEYIRSIGETFLKSYIRENPDKLEQRDLDIFSQVEKTNYIGHFQVLSIVPGKYIEAEDYKTDRTSLLLCFTSRCFMLVVYPVYMKFEFKLFRIYT